MTTYLPDEKWPHHSKAFWRAAMDTARAGGWTLRYVDAPHTFGYISCPGGCHKYKVDKTAVGAESFARDAETAVRECPQSLGSRKPKVKTRLAVVEGLLDKVDDLLREIDLMLPMATARMDAELRLEELEMMLATANLSLSDLEDLFEEEAKASAHFESLIDAPEVREVVEILGEASDATHEAEITTQKISRAGLRKPLTVRIETAKQRISEAKLRLL